MSCLANGCITSAAAAAAAALKAPGDKGVSCTFRRSCQGWPGEMGPWGRGWGWHLLQDRSHQPVCLSPIFMLSLTVVQGVKKFLPDCGVGCPGKGQQVEAAGPEFWRMGHWPISGYTHLREASSPLLQPFLHLPREKLRTSQLNAYSHPRPLGRRDKDRWSLKTMWSGC